MGLPRGSTVKSVTATNRPEPDGERTKLRSLGCENGHEFQVLFEW
jgi:Fe2+ transport system protein FeoA